MVITNKTVNMLFIMNTHVILSWKCIYEFFLYILGFEYHFLNKYDKNAISRLEYKTAKLIITRCIADFLFY